MTYLGIFLACIGVPALILSIAFLAWLADQGDRFPRCCDWCENERSEARSRSRHPAGRDL